MYPTLDVQTTLTYARVHQDDVRAAFPRRRRTLLRRSSSKPRTLAPAPGPTQHHPATA